MNQTKRFEILLVEDNPGNIRLTREAFKQNLQLKKIPVIILSTSENDQDIRNSYENHANCYLTKPIDFDSFTQVIGQMQNFWLSLVKLPSLH